ncbi:Transmembrane protein 107 [Apodemus speciosus]|uniref:Transmembrane protein 107 n=1 Tax=Apodemus speciosus TaxID=105296 RepID=A0ABQ0FB52_APOSI
MARISGLVPSRFLTLLAHLVVVITLFWSRESNIQQLVAALCLTLGLFAPPLACPAVTETALFIAVFGLKKKPF